MDRYFVKNNDIEITKGYLRSIIIDFHKRQVYFVSNNDVDKLINNVITLETYNDSELINMILSNNLFTEVEKRFKKNFAIVSNDFQIFSHISNFIFEVNNLLDLENYLKHYNKVKSAFLCYNALIIVKNKVNIKNFISILKNFLPNDFISIELIFNKDVLLDDEDVIKINKLKISNIIILSRQKSFENHGKKLKIVRFNGKIDSGEGVKNIYSFILTKEHYLESLYFNTYYNAKLFISEYGKIKRFYGDTISFGDFLNKSEIELRKIIKSKQFTKYWKVKKDNFLICNVCEFRNICCDNRKIIKHKTGKWYSSKECSYNPYIAKWDTELQYSNLSDVGIKLNNNVFEINYDTLHKNINKIWHE